MTRFQDRVNEQRQVLAAVGTLILALGAASIGSPEFMRRPVSAERPPMLLTLAVLEQPPKPVEPLLPTRAVQQPASKPLPAARPTSVANPVSEAKPTASAVPDAPAPTQAAQTPAAVPSQVAVAAPPQVHAPAIAPPPVPAVVAAEPARPAAAPAVAAPNPEPGFVAQLRAQVNAAKRYPTGREASLQRPSGKVTIWFVLSRNGNLVDAGVQDSSNSIILDNAALSTVRRASFPAWPDGAWAAESSHRFSVTLDFVPPL